MRIQLDKKHFLNSDQYCFWITTTVENKKTAGKDYERVVSGYHHDVINCISSYINRKFGGSEAVSILELRNEVEELKKQIKKWKPKVERKRGNDE